MDEIDFDMRLRTRLANNLANHEVRTHELDGRRHAAVAVVVIDSDADRHGSGLYSPDLDQAEEDRVSLVAEIPGTDTSQLTGRIDGTAGGAAILLTRRGARLSSHGGQWALPGGRLDRGETASDAVVREVEEEVGLAVDPADLLGRLDDYPTRSGYVISPFVFWCPSDAEPIANPDEVASVHRVAIGELTKEPRFVTIPESDRPVIQVPIGGDLIHAPTGAIIHQFRAVAYDGSATRVDGYEQPVFAWK